MALITRVSRLFRADLHSVLDRIEEPDALLRQAVREMQEALDCDAHQAKLLKREQAQLIARQTDLERSLGEIEEELDVCFASDKDDLARKLIKRKLETQRFSSILSRKRQALAGNLGELTTRLKENHSRLESKRQKADLLAKADHSDPPKESWSTPELSVREEDVEVAFLREKQQRSQS